MSKNLWQSLFNRQADRLEAVKNAPTPKDRVRAARHLRNASLDLEDLSKLEAEREASD